MNLEPTLNAIWYGPYKALGLLLSPLSLVFWCIVRARRWLYRVNLLPAHRTDVPVVVVGNLAVGGTGKTPLVAEVCRRLLNKGHLPGVITRGYGGESTSWPQAVSPESDPRLVGDEPVMLARQLSCPVVAAPQRIDAARYAVEQFQCTVLVSDDGLSHYALERDAEVVVVDAIRGVGSGLCLPGGPLREPLSRLKEAEVVYLNTTSHPTREGTAIATSDVLTDTSFELQPVCLEALNGPPMTLEELRGLSIRAVAGIGNPQRFFTTLKLLGADVEGLALKDHHQFVQQDLDALAGIGPLVVTEKDAVKLTGLRLPEQCYVLKVRVVMNSAGDEAMNALLDSLSR